MKAGVGAELRPHRLDRVEQPPGVVAAAQARLPRPGGGVKHRGDAVGYRLPVAFGQRDVDRKIDAGARHHLPLEGVAMDVDDARAAPAGRWRRSPAPPSRRPDRSPRSRSPSTTIAALVNVLAEQRPAAVDAQMSVMPAPGCWFGGVASIVRQLYLSMKASTGSLRKSGSACRKRVVVPVPPRQLDQSARRSFRRSGGGSAAPGCRRRWCRGRHPWSRRRQPPPPRRCRCCGPAARSRHGRSRRRGR